MAQETHQERNISDLIPRIANWIRDWFSKNGGENAIVGISGGKDSSVVAALCAQVLGKDHVIGVIMPNLHQSDIDDSYYLCDTLGIRRYTVPVTMPVVDTLNQLFNSDIRVSDQAYINLPARIRMATLYAVAQSMNGRVANTCNLSEDWIGWSTRWGDSVGDFCPIARLTATEVVEIGRQLGLPDRLMDKPPADGLTGNSDEDNFGFSYEVLDRYIRTGVCKSRRARESIDFLHQKNAFKLYMPDAFDPDCSVQASEKTH